jgi:sugar/nucleoside kinase (ribokinase family)
VLCIGIPVRDLTFRVPTVPPRGDKAHATHYAEIAGGNALNAAIGIARLGGKAAIAGPMGPEGTSMLDDLAKEDILTRGIVRHDDVVTPISAIMIDEGGERTIVTYRDPKLMQTKLGDTDALLTDCGAILTESRCAPFATEICAEAKRRGIPVVVDGDQIMSLREGLLTASSHIIFSLEPLKATAAIDDPVKALQKLAGVTDAFLAVTLGPQGMIWLDAKGEPRHMPSFPVHTVDTLGAGDVFHGAFTLEIANGAAIEAAMRFSAAAAALKCTRFGGAFAAPGRAEVDAFLAKAAPKS